MAKILVISEKPSVSQAIAGVLILDDLKKEDGFIKGKGEKDDYVISWCLGHLAEYVFPEAYDEKYQKWRFEDLPILPDPWVLEISHDKRKQYTILKKLLNDKSFDFVVNACDAGREGELIFKRVYDQAQSTLPAKRLWISSMEDTAIREGFQNLKDESEYQNLQAASECRAKADWLIGINATRAFTTKYNYRLTVGRVQTPTLAFMTEREKEIRGFQKQKYFMTHLLVEGLDAVSGHFESKYEADNLAKKCKGQKVTVQKVIREEKSIQPPKLYYLTSLQRDANKVFGFTAARTLELTQGLYEKKLVTYPRTDSQYLTDDMGGTATAVIQAIEEKIPFATGLSYEPDVKRVQNSKKVSDHHAIVPTVQIRNADLSALSVEETKILYMIADRLLAATSEKETYESVRIVLESEGKTFTTAGRHILHDGFHAMELAMKHYFHMDKEPEESEEKDSTENAEQEIRFPVLSNGQDLGYADTKVTEHFTKPPKCYTESSLLSAMERAGVSDMDQDVERKGLGTPATRASIIEKLVSGKFVTRQKKQLIPTEDGMKLIEILPESLKAAKLTAKWENELLQMEKGQCREQDFMNGITGLVSAVLAECSEITPEQKKAFGGDGSKEHKEIGTCPVCGSPVYEGKKNFYCSNRDCDFALWKENRYLESMKKTIDEKNAEALLKHGRCHVKGLYSKKTGKTFEADLLYSFVDGKGQFGLDFSNNPKSKKGDAHD